MKCVPIWVDKVQDNKKIAQCIYSCCFHPNGSILLVAAGQVILVYSCTDGSVVESLRGHKEDVYCVAYSKDGKKFASGGADKVVIVWNSKLEPTLRYTHNDAIQCVSFHPIVYSLLSCSTVDFAFWSLEQKTVQKFKISSRINACSWNSTGQILALGLGNGNISMRNVNGDEKFVIDRSGSNNNSEVPIWSLMFSPLRNEKEVLCVTDWAGKLTFYAVDGRKISKERNIGTEALSVCYSPRGEYILICGCDKQCTLLNRDGTNLGIIGKPQQSWVWTCAFHPSAPFVVFGCQDGTVCYYQLMFSTVHGLYKERYAYRENMTDVMIQNLTTNDKVQVKCKDRIKKIAIYKNRLAVMLPSKIIIYEMLIDEESTKMQYRVKQIIHTRLDCNLLVVCSNHLILCQESILKCMDFKGNLISEWVMDSLVRYIRLIGGPPSNEYMIAGLEDGQVVKIYINNPCPVNLVKTTNAVVCLDVNISGKKLAVINADNRCIVYDMVSLAILYQEMKAISVCWNSLSDDILCYSGFDYVNIKMGNYQPYQQSLSGYVVGMHGSKVFLLNNSVIFTIDVPLSACMYHCIEKQSFRDAYKVACLGVTDEDWSTLARNALEGFDLNVAMKAYTRIRDLKHLDLIQDYMEGKYGKDQTSFLADVFSNEGKYKEAGRLYQKCGQEQKALSMYTDLRLFDLAQEFAVNDGSTDKKALIRKKAEWARNINEPRAAAEMYITAGDVMKAVEIAGENGWIDMLLDIAGKVDKNDKECVKRIANHLCKLGELETAGELYGQLGEHENVLELHINMKNWTAAFALIQSHPQYKQTLYVPYANWLIQQQKYLQAQQALYEGGKHEEACKMIFTLMENAIGEGSFDDVGYYHWILSRQYLKMAQTSDENKEQWVNKFWEHDKYAVIYSAYNVIQNYMEEPFTSYQPEALFNISRYLQNEMRGTKIPGVTQFAVLYTLARQSRTLGAFKLARQVLDRLQSILVPPQFREFVDLAWVMARGKPYHDKEDLLLMCYRCSTYNPLMVTVSASRYVEGNCCVNCKQPFVHSCLTFEVLPLIEFELEDGISDSEAMKLLQSTKIEDTKLDHNISSISIDDFGQNVTDLFTATLVNLETNTDKFRPIVVNRETLLSMESNSVLVCEWPAPLKYKYYRNLVPELQVTACSSCMKIFHVDDYEMEILRRGHCPFCRVETISRNDGPTIFEDT